MLERLSLEATNIVKTEIQSRLDGSLGIDDKDIEIIRGLLKDIDSRRNSYVLLESLDKLVPMRVGCKRIIADFELSSGQEKLIRSRKESRPVEIADAGGWWFDLPSEIKTEIINSGNLSFGFELTGECTVACKFCGLAKIGHIHNKIGFKSIVNVMGDLDRLGRGIVDHPSDVKDTFYEGNDVFDWKDFDKVGKKWVDFTDLMQIYIDKYGNRRSYYISTGIPLGEELKVLSGMLLHAKSVKEGNLSRYSDFRISLRDDNKVRSDLILALFTGLMGNPEDYGISVSENRDNSYKLNGRTKTAESRDLDMGDVVGVPSRDSLIYSFSGLEEQVRVGLSLRQYPNCARRRSAFLIDASGGTEYRIPRYDFEVNLHEKIDLSILYPDLRYTKIRKVDGKYIKEEEVEINAHRSYLRLTALCMHFLSKDNRFGWKEETLEDAQKMTIRNHLQRDYQAVGEYLSKTLSSDQHVDMEMVLVYRYAGKIMKG